MLNHEQVQKLEGVCQEMAVLRRISLCVLLDDFEANQAPPDLADCVTDYIDHLEYLLGLAKTAQTRLI